MIESRKHCPECGYTEEDALIHWDHHLCKGKIPGYEKKDLSEQNRKRDDIQLEEVTSNAWDKFKEELLTRPTIWQPSPKDISDALNAYPCTICERCE